MFPSRRLPFDSSRTTISQRERQLDTNYDTLTVRNGTQDSHERGEERILERTTRPPVGGKNRCLLYKTQRKKKPGLKMEEGQSPEREYQNIPGLGNSFVGWDNEF